jgi:cell division septation protein DedD
MRILVTTAIAALALPFMALGQTDQQQPAQEQKSDMQKAPRKDKKMRDAQAPSRSEAKPDAAKPGTGTNMRDTRDTRDARDTRGETDVRGRSGEDANRSESGASSSTTTRENNVRGTNQTTTVNKQEFRSHHEEVFKLGRHPKDFFVQRYGASHFRLIGDSYFVFVDNCWVAVDVDGFVYSERVICPGDPEYVVID